MADTCHAIVAPVGEAFRTSIAFDSTTELYQADLSHPSLNGSFLAASVFYNIFFHKSALGNSYDPGVTQQPAYMFHLFAHQTVEDSLNFINLGINEPWAEFTWHEAPGCNGVFNGKSNSNFSHFWDFGDSTTSTDSSPVHQYMYSRYYPVTHIVYNSCESDTFRLTNNMVCNGASVSEISENNFSVFPNPVSGKLFIKPYSSHRSSGEISIYNVFGEIVLAVSPLSFGEGLGGEADVSNFPGGIYFLRIADEHENFSTLKFTIIR